ncbi:extracellular solute-binding protein [Leifsonia xyli]|uniref:extracellular solute-binding protein n=1 Tax=Leifsonia xyli TaxID=1575 RepID=UPI00042723B4|nr:extracellular solute-binding protein [Leifsonia xyli]
MAKNAPDLVGKIGAVPIPGKESGISPSVLGGSHLSMFESAENKDLAWAFIKMMTTGTFEKKWTEQIGYFSGLNSLVKETMKTDDPLVKPFATQMVDGGASLPVSPNFGKVQAKQTTNTMIQAILSGQKTVDQATSDAAKEMTDLLNSK